MILVDSLMSFTCRRFSRHVATGIEPLSGGVYDKVQFWAHWAICPFCRRYWKEMEAISLVHISNTAKQVLPPARSADLKARLKKNLRGKTL
jgi:hypothetical protein